MNFVKVTKRIYDSSKVNPFSPTERVLINLDHVVEIATGRYGTSLIFGPADHLYVMETPEQIMALVRNDTTPGSSLVGPVNDGGAS